VSDARGANNRYRPPRLIVLASGSGTTLQAILDDPHLRPHVVAVGSDRDSTGALDRATTAGIDGFVVRFADYDDRGDWNRAFEKELESRDPDLIVLAGFMRLFDSELVSRFRIVNTHPALLPSFPGVGIRAVREALAHGVKLTGVTVHWVDEGMDTGPIIAQVAVPVAPDDDEHSLFERIKAAEKPLYTSTIRTLISENA
jgi:formyltetrahydrofolate-dependent phosphoribosylglycinamide formyltransferase